MNPNDEIRRQILHWFYDRNADATSQYGKKGSAAKISDIKKGLKQAHGLSQSQVMSNLTYLIDKGWVNRSDVEKTVRTRGGTTVPSTVAWYEISADGIDKIEGESEFQLNPRFAGINIQASGSNIITLGDGNIVNAEFEDLHRSLGELREIAKASGLSEEQKLDVVVDIESIREQLAKPKPDKTMIGHLWARVQEVATVGGFMEAVERLATLIWPLLPA